jgi:hypothetical protein
MRSLLALFSILSSLLELPNIFFVFLTLIPGLHYFLKLRFLDYLRPTSLILLGLIYTSLRISTVSLLAGFSGVNVFPGFYLVSISLGFIAAYQLIRVENFLRIPQHIVSSLRFTFNYKIRRVAASVFFVLVCIVSYSSNLIYTNFSAFILVPVFIILNGFEADKLRLKLVVVAVSFGIMILPAFLGLAALNRSTFMRAFIGLFIVMFVDWLSKSLKYSDSLINYLRIFFRKLSLRNLFLSLLGMVLAISVYTLSTLLKIQSVQLEQALAFQLNQTGNIQGMRILIQYIETIHSNYPYGIQDLRFIGVKQFFASLAPRTWFPDKPEFAINQILFTDYQIYPHRLFFEPFYFPIAELGVLGPAIYATFFFSIFYFSLRLLPRGAYLWMFPLYALAMTGAFNSMYAFTRTVLIPLIVLGVVIRFVIPFFLIKRSRLCSLSLLRVSAVS